MSNPLKSLQKAWDENPQQVLIAVGLFALGAAKLLDATTRARNARTYRLEVDRRVKAL